MPNNIHSKSCSTHVFSSFTPRRLHCPRMASPIHPVSTDLPHRSCCCCCCCCPPSGHGTEHVGPADDGIRWWSLRWHPDRSAATTGGPTAWLDEANCRPDRATVLSAERAAIDRATRATYIRRLALRIGAADSTLSLANRFLQRHQLRHQQTAAMRCTQWNVK